MTDLRVRPDEREMAAADLPESSLAALPRVAERPAPAPGIAEVYAAHFRYVWRCLRALGVRDALLDDAVQDVFLVVQKKLGAFDGRHQLRTWLYAIALHVARRYRAAAAEEARRREPALDGAGELVTHESSERALEHGERLELARRALERLDDEKREVFVLAHVEQMSAPEIAEAAGVPLNTVYSRLRAARLEFGAHVARLDPTRRKP